MTRSVPFHRNGVLTVPLTVLSHRPITSMTRTLSYYCSNWLVITNHVREFCYNFDYTNYQKNHVLISSSVFVFQLWKLAPHWCYIPETADNTSGWQTNRRKTLESWDNPVIWKHPQMWTFHCLSKQKPQSSYDHRKSILEWERLNKDNNGFIWIYFGSWKSQEYQSTWRPP